MALALALLLLTPIGLRPYEALILDPPPKPKAQRPELMLMTALPIVWGEGGAFDPGSRPAAAYQALEREFAVRPLDVLGEEELARGKLLLLAQPRMLAPRELVALDAWVRAGGRALILSDPWLLWPSELPLGDVRRPPPVGLLAPVLTHWGLRMARPEAREIVDTRIGNRRVVLAAPGTIATSNPACRVDEAGRLARCRIGRGEVILLADADLLQDGLWAAPGPHGEERHQRLSDNPLLVADLLDALGGVRRSRVDGNVAWFVQDASLARAAGYASIPLLLVFAAAGILATRRRRRG
jgi:hypothetical protein